jgi:hypothetical protein
LGSGLLPKQIPACQGEVKGLSVVALAILYLALFMFLPLPTLELALEEVEAGGELLELQERQLHSPQLQEWLQRAVPWPSSAPATSLQLI